MTAPVQLPPGERTRPAAASQHERTHQSSNGPNTAAVPTKARAMGPLDDPSVACVFCLEPIEISSFKAGSPHARTASCENCGLLVSVAEHVWSLWSHVNSTTDVDRRLAERLRARRVATAARAIRDHVAETLDPADGSSWDCEAAEAHPAGLPPRSRPTLDASPTSSSTHESRRTP